MRRALGAVTPWDTFKQMTDAQDAGEVLNKATEHDSNAGKVHVTEHVHRAALPHSHEDQVGHKAMHGSDERKEHKSPESVKH